MSTIPERQADAIERERQVLLLRQAKLSYREIAERVPGLSTAASAQRAYRRALARDVPVELIAEVRTQELADLDLQEQRALGIQASKHYVVSNGKIVNGPDGTPLDDDSVKLRAIDMILRIKARRAAYLGLDAPTRARVEFIPVDALEAAVADFRRELEIGDTTALDAES